MKVCKRRTLQKSGGVILRLLYVRRCPASFPSHRAVEAFMSGNSVTLYSFIPILFGHGGFGKNASDPLSLLEIYPSIEVAQSFPAIGKTERYISGAVF